MLKTSAMVFGVIFIAIGVLGFVAIVAVLGLFYGNTPLLGIMAHNWADVWLHVVIAAVALYLGFAHRERTVGTATTTPRR